MKAVTWHGRRDVRVEDVPDPIIEQPTDAIVRITSSGICGSDLHLYEVLGPFMNEGDILGHEPMGIVEEVGSEVREVTPGDRVVMPFQISCGVPEGPPDERFVYLSDVLPTAWQAVEYAAIPDGGSVAVLGLGPIGDMSCRIALHRGHRVIGVDLVPERLGRARERSVEVLDLSHHERELAEVIRELTDGRGPDSVIDAVGMEAHGAPLGRLAQQISTPRPDAVSKKVMEKAGVDRLGALHLAVDVVRRGGTISLIGVYGGMADPLPMLRIFDKQVQLRMGQANVKRWVDDIMPLLTDGDPLGVEGFATHRLPLERAPEGYELFQKKQDGAIKVLLQP
jgi:threonine dehydrogenase-like Zn-dependent dehydrogenase